ncbi:MAG TPA: tetraacyldisaccharide 4'-kinase [Gemmataceae bacterium]|nr:tetraacyldisaccharide 4'-kinase [Gemmataceae bacterium]
MSERFHALVRGERRGPLASLARLGLWGASAPYRLGVGVRNSLFDRGWKKVYRAAVPVVCVGNLTLGGTGKTPFVEYVARFYRDLGVRVAILSRGYGSEAGRNDEAMVLEENLPDVPHLQGRDRVALANTAVEELEAELLVLDDGFQHRRLHRDLDVVLIDATRPPQCDWVFPRGTLREPVGGLQRAGVIVLTRCDQVPPERVDEIRRWLAARFPTTPVATTAHAPVELIGGDGVTAPVEELCGESVAAFCGIGNPAAFRRTLESLGANVTAFRNFPDHHAYTLADVDDLRAWASNQSVSAVATTQKDWVKLRTPDLGGRPLWAVRIGMKFRDGEDRLTDALRAVAPT